MYRTVWVGIVINWLYYAILTGYISLLLALLVDELGPTSIGIWNETDGFGIIKCHLSDISQMIIVHEPELRFLWDNSPYVHHDSKHFGRGGFRIMGPLPEKIATWRYQFFSKINLKTSIEIFVGLHKWDDLSVCCIFLWFRLQKDNPIIIIIILINQIKNTSDLSRCFESFAFPRGREHQIPTPFQPDSYQVSWIMFWIRLSD